MNREELLQENNKKSLTRSEKREFRKQRLKERLLRPDDIKYQGPFSYRALRIIAWVAIALGQIAFLNAISTSLVGWNPVGVFESVFQFIGALATPLFIVASFGLVLNRKRSYLTFIAIYGAAFLAIGIGVGFFYFRYISGVFVQIGLDQTSLFNLVTDILSSHVQINVFADLFAFSLFNFFLNYTPRKVFKGKKIVIFRLFMILPVVFVITSYVLKVMSGLELITLPFYFYPFFATRNPIIFATFAVASIWIKYRERLFLRLGATREEYHRYSLTKRNSLSFSIHLSIFVLLAAIIEGLMIIVVALIYSGISDESTYVFTVLNAYDLGQGLSMIFAIPLLFLYSYTRIHKNTLIDIFIPIGGIGLCALVYIEGMYQFITYLVSK